MQLDQLCAAVEKTLLLKTSGCGRAQAQYGPEAEVPDMQLCATHCSSYLVRCPIQGWWNAWTRCTADTDRWSQLFAVVENLIHRPITSDWSRARVAFISCLRTQAAL